MSRIALQDYTFADGTFAPKGAIVSVAVEAIQADPAYYAEPDVFDPWRFVRVRGKGKGEDDDNEDGEDGTARLETTSLEFLTFGHGQHAWCVFRLVSPFPSRFTEAS